MDNVVEHRDLEEAEQRCIRMVSGEADRAEVCGDARDESEDTHEQENCTEEP